MFRRLPAPFATVAWSIRAVRAQMLAERDRWVLWLAPALGLGVACYFALPSEPPSWATVPLWTLLFVALLILRRRGPATLLLLALGAVLLGYQIAQLRSLAVAAPVLEREMGPVRIEGRVLEVEAMGRGLRLLLTAMRIEGLSPDATPARVRVSASAASNAPAPGSRVALLARLRPPPAPAAPGDYDFARAAWFQELGAVGFAFGRPELSAEPVVEAGWVGRWRILWADLRRRVAERVLEALPQRTAGVVVALLTGQRGTIAAEDLEAMRYAGLAHLLAISGLHVGLVTGTLFLAVRAGLALWPAAALRLPTKRIAAVAALLAAGLYLMLAGAPVPTQRAFLMTALVMLGVLVDRTAITLRLVGWAALVVLLNSPEALLSASFQLSFAAVVALVSTYESLRRWREARIGRREPKRLWTRPLSYIGGLALTSLIAGLATAPLTLHHFDEVPLYGIIANLAAVPLTAMLIMPAALFVLALMPFGLEGAALEVMALGVQAVLAVAAWVAQLDGSVLLVPAMAWWGLPACVLGGLWLCLWQRPWRLLGLVPLALGLASVAWTPPPDVVMAGDGRLLAVRAADGDLLLNSRRVNRFSAQQWLGRSGVREAGLLPEAGNLAHADLSCDRLGCLLQRDSLVIALVLEGESLEEDCRHADLLLATIPVPQGCRRGTEAPLEVIDSRDLRRDGGLALWLEPEGGFRLQRVSQTRGRRPWSSAQTPDPDAQ